MRKLLVACLLCLVGCVSSARHWEVDNVEHAARDNVVDVAMVWLPAIWERWPVTFTVSAFDDADGVIEINYIAKRGGLIGRAYPGAENLRGPYYGVFYKKMREDHPLMSDQAMGLWLAMVISHEIGHAYGLLLHEDKRYVMNKNVPMSFVPWSPKSIEHLDKVLGVKQSEIGEPWKSN